MVCSFRPYEGKEPYIFASYSHADGETVGKILDYLDSQGFRIWFDGGIEWGSEWPEVIAEHLDGCAVCLPFLSRSFMDSQNCRQEILYAHKQKKNFLSVYLEETPLTKGIDMQLSPYQQTWLNRSGSLEQFCQKLADTPILQACRREKDPPKKPAEAKKPAPQKKSAAPTPAGPFRWKRVAAALAALAVAACIGFGLWRARTSSGPAEAAVQDFGAFAGGLAVDKPDSGGVGSTGETKGYRLIPAETGEALIEEYVGLLTESYPFALRDTHEAQNGAYVWRCYLLDYTGPGEIEPMSPTFYDVTLTGHVLVYIVSDSSEGDVTAYVCCAKGVTARDDGHVTGCRVDTYTVQDFAAFAGDCVLDTEVDQEKGNFVGYTFTLAAECFDTVVEEYTALLDRGVYPFTPDGTQSYEQESGGWRMEWAWYQTVDGTKLRGMRYSYEPADLSIQSTPMLLEAIAGESGVRQVKLWVSRDIVLADGGWRTSAAPQPPSVPDFLDFANGYAHVLESECVTHEDRCDWKCEYTGRAGDTLIPEYIDLLTGSGRFRLLGSRIGTGNSVTAAYYWFAYEGSGDVTAFSLSSGIGEKFRMDNIHLLLADTRKMAGGGTLLICRSPEMELAATEERTTYEGDGAYTLQDFTAFTDGEVTAYTTSEQDLTRYYAYRLTGDEAVSAAEQYIELMGSCVYPYYCAGTYSYIGGRGEENSNRNATWFQPLGPGKPLQDFCWSKDSDRPDVGSTVLYMEMIEMPSGGRYLWVWVSKDIALVDDGWRAR